MADEASNAFSGMTPMGLVSGGLNILGNYLQGEQQKSAATEQFNRQQQLNAQQQAYNTNAVASQNAYNAVQADVARQFSAQQQGQAQAFNADQAELNRQFQERMSSTAYQRSRADMAAAGLNPILAATAGGASTPGGGQGAIGAVGGAQASGAASSAGLGIAQKRDTPNLMANAISSALEASKLQPAIDLMKSQAGTQRAQQSLLAAQEDQARAGAENTRKATSQMGAHVSIGPYSGNVEYLREFYKKFMSRQSDAQGFIPDTGWLPDIRGAIEGEMGRASTQGTGAGSRPHSNTGSGISIAPVIQETSSSAQAVRRGRGDATYYTPH